MNSNGGRTAGLTILFRARCFKHGDITHGFLLRQPYASCAYVRSMSELDV
jgi:hypothetical protein